MTRRARELGLLLLGSITVLFFLLRLAGDPAAVIAGPDATPEQLELVRAEYGLDQPLPVQYARYLGQLAQLDFGTSLADDAPAIDKVLAAWPASLMLAGMALLTTVLVSLPLGIWLGGHPRARLARLVRGGIFVLQGFPGFVTALLLVQLFAIQLELVPALGFGTPATWILPSIAVASFLAPKLVRLVEANVSASLEGAYVRTAQASGLSDRAILWGQVAPNALLGAVALIGAQAAFLVTGLVIVETIFAWPGIGLLLVQSTTNLDFPVIQAITITVVVAVYLVNLLSDAVQRLLDPRIAGQGSPA
ncbi:MAG: ABC transporter permease [Alphaproteobacteria bacterium]|nr:ABC transporter permease [Alphaproteobacteria bacterium]